VRIPGVALFVFEAKIGSHLPSARQLAQYARRCRRLGWPVSRLVALTRTDEASGVAPRGWHSLGVPVHIRSWRWLAQRAGAASRKERRPVVRFVLRELTGLLEDFVGLERVYSNLVYVVSLGSGHLKRWGLSWIDIVEKASALFLPVRSEELADPSELHRVPLQGEATEHPPRRAISSGA
jgi:hypothetical protein